MVSPAAIAWPPKRSMVPGLRVATVSSRSRTWTPGIDRTEPLRCSPSASGANAATGRCRRSFTLEARMPTTPACQSSRNSATAAPGTASSTASSRAAAWRCIPASISRRSAFRASSSAAMRIASSSSSLSRHSMPRRMSVSRPAALSLGPAAKPRSAATTCPVSRPATRSSAVTPGDARPARIRRSPCSTRMRLLWSRCTTSATVPTATRSRSEARSGPAAPPARSRRRARSALST